MYSTEVINLYANIKLIDNEIAGLLKERENLRQKLCYLMPNIDSVDEFKEVELVVKQYDTKTYKKED